MTGAALAAMTMAGGLWNAAPAFAGADPVITDVCTDSETTGTTITLTGDCETTETLTVPDTYTLDGGGHTITAVAGLTGTVLQNAGSVMHLRNLTVVGNPDGTAVDYGVRFNDASGSMDNVTVENVTQHSTILTGRAIWIEAPAGSDQKVDITGVTVTGFQRTGLGAYGGVTVNVSNSTFGPPDTSMNSPDTPQDNVGQNTVQYGGGAGGTFTGNTVIGSTAGRPDTTSAGLLVYGAANLTVSDNTFGGAGLDVGINVIQWAGMPSTGITIENNTFNREPPPEGFQDFWGRGVSVDSVSSEGTSLTGNIFNEAWQEALFPPTLTQPPVITTTSLPAATVGEEYAATLEASSTANAVEATTASARGALTWSLVDGSLSPGLTLSSDGAITGTPTQAGEFTFTVQVTDSNQESSTAPFTIAVGQVSPSTGTHTHLQVRPASHSQKKGREVALIAHVHGCDAGPATGTVTFTVNGTPFDHPVELNASQTATLVTRDLPAGLLTIRAVYSGNDVCSGSTSRHVHVLITTRAPGVPVTKVPVTG